MNPLNEQERDQLIALIRAGKPLPAGGKSRRMQAMEKI
jgi:hypothetical protein